MFLILAFVGSLISSSQATFDDMDDEDFAAYVNQAGEASEKYGESAGKGCIGGAIASAPSGLPALCVGCALGAVGNVAQDVIFRNEKADKALERK